MKTLKIILALTLSILLFISCNSSKSIQQEMQKVQTGLYYDLSTDVYRGKITHTVYLNFIDYSNMEYAPMVKKKGTFVYPLLLINFWKEKYKITLGESTLMQPYREFLTEALLAECNRSTCFSLVENLQDTNPSDTTYVLNVKVLQNNTTSEIISNDLFIPFLSDWDLDLFESNYTINPAVSDLKLAVRLTQGENLLFEKTFHIQQKLKYQGVKQGELSYVSTNCMDNMTVCLSNTTQHIVEEISRFLHFAFLHHS
jgi:hypothetical protein